MVTPASARIATMAYASLLMGISLPESPSIRGHATGMSAVRSSRHNRTGKQLVTPNLRGSPQCPRRPGAALPRIPSSLVWPEPGLARHLDGRGGAWLAHLRADRLGGAAGAGARHPGPSLPAAVAGRRQLRRPAFAP